MRFLNLFDSVKRAARPARHHPAYRQPAQCRLAVEALDDRCLPSFSSPVNYAVAPSQAVLTGDFTGDGRSDLAFANAAGRTVSVLVGNADGTFRPAVTSNA